MCILNDDMFVQPNNVRSLFQKPTHAVTAMKCDICGKAEEVGKPCHIVRYGKFICSRECADEQRRKMKLASIDKTDIQLLFKMVLKRRKIAKFIEDYAKKIEDISHEMYEKKIHLAVGKYAESWYRLLPDRQSGNPKKYNWGCVLTDQPKIEINASYICSFMSNVNMQIYYKKELENIDAYLRSGKCIHYRTI